MRKYTKYIVLFLFVLTVFWPSPALAKELFDDKVVFVALEGNASIFETSIP